MKNQLIIIVACLTMVACKKENEKKDETSPEVIINTPSVGFSVSDSTIISITGTVADAGELHEASINITRNSDGVVLYSKSLVVGELTSYNINESYLSPAVSTATNVTLTITAEDHTPNIGTKSVSFVIHP